MAYPSQIHIVVSEGDLNVLSLVCCNFPKIPALAPFDACNDVGGDHLDGLVVVGGGSVVEFTAVCDLVFHGYQLLLEFHEVGVGLQIWVLFSDHVDARNHTCKEAFSCGDTFDVTLCEAASSCITGLSELVKDTRFVLSVAFHDVDKVWNHVVALFEQNVDVGPRFFGVFIKTDETVLC